MLKDLESFKALQAHFEKTKDIHMRDLFADDVGRANKYTLHLDDFCFDYSKNRITDGTMPLLFDLATECHVEQKRDEMFAGKRINFTENRHVLHTALRNRANTPV